MLSTQEELAILGGRQAVGAGAVQPWPQVVAADKAAVMGVLERGVLWGAAAPEAMALQEEWAAYVGARHCLATNSGTAALHMAVAAAGRQGELIRRYRYLLDDRDRDPLRPMHDRAPHSASPWRPLARQLLPHRPRPRRRRIQRLVPHWRNPVPHAEPVRLRGVQRGVAART